MRRRRPPAARPATRAGLFERTLFRFMGPPELGDAHAPRAAPHDAAADLCPRCGQPWDAHPRVRTATRSYATCPAQPS